MITSGLNFNGCSTVSKMIQWKKLTKIPSLFLDADSMYVKHQVQK